MNLCYGFSGPMTLELIQNVNDSLLRNTDDALEMALKKNELMSALKFATRTEQLLWEDGFKMGYLAANTLRY